MSEMTSGLVERIEELGSGLIDGLQMVMATKQGDLGPCSTVALHLPLEWEGEDWIITIETKADHEAAARAPLPAPPAKDTI